MTRTRSSLAAAQAPRVDAETVKREGWRGQGILVVDINDPRLAWPDRTFLEQLGTRLYGARADVDQRRPGGTD